MRNQFIIACLAILLFACADKPTGYVIHGKAENESSGMAYLQAFRNKMFFTVDSATIVNGAFTFEGKVAQPELFGIKTTNMVWPLQLFVENTSMQVSITNGANKLVIENSPLNTFFLMNQEKVQEDDFDIEALVAAHPSSEVAAFFLYRYFTYRLPLDQLKKVRAMLSPKLATCPYVLALNSIIEQLDNVQVGMKAPEFSLPDTAGVTQSLADFKGKYTLIDFWASWCPPCRAENPSMVKAYQSFKDKNFTILAVSLDKDKKAWTEAIAKDGLTWTHVSDLKYWDSEVPCIYGVRGIPANILIDPEGIIVAINLHGDALTATLQKVLQ